MNDFITAQLLATFSGMVIAVNLVVQATKAPIKKRWGDAAVRYYAYLPALVLVALFGGYPFTGQGVALMVLNALLVGLTATGLYESAADPKAQKRKESD